MLRKAAPHLRAVRAFVLRRPDHPRAGDVVQCRGHDQAPVAAAQIAGQHEMNVALAPDRVEVGRIAPVRRYPVELSIAINNLGVL